MRNFLIMNILIFICYQIYASNPAINQLQIENEKKTVVIKAINKHMHVKVSPPKIFLEGKSPTATFDVTYNGFSAQAQTAFQYAVDIWSSLITSPVQIKVIANWIALDGNILGSASASTFYRDFDNVPQPGTWYSTALAEKLYGAELNHADSADIRADFNSDFNNWYFGTDGNTPAGKYDFVTVVLHELGHGLGFQGSMDIENGQGSWGFGSGYPFIFDRFVENNLGQILLTTTLFPNPSTQLANQLIGDNIYFNGVNANSSNGGNPVKLFAPSPWDAGSSYSHLDESTFPASNPNSLMTPSLGAAEAIHHPGNICLSIFKDVGWTVQLNTNITNVYPGDTDNNGVVNELDILPIGVYFLNQGYSRDNISLTWQAYEVFSWNVPEATFADANGNGVVDETDVIAIGINWGNSSTTSIESYEIDVQDKSLLNLYKGNFEVIYKSLSGDNEAVNSMKTLLESILGIEINPPEKFIVEQNYPNPFNPATNINFSLPVDQQVTLTIYDILGKLVAKPIENQYYKAGRHNYKLNASSLSSGIYTYNIRTDKYNKTRKMIVVK